MADVSVGEKREEEGGELEKKGATSDEQRQRRRAFPRSLALSRARTLLLKRKKKKEKLERAIMSDPPPPAPAPSAAAAAALSRRSEPRQLKELRNLAPWRWDKLCDKHPPGKTLEEEKSRESRDESVFFLFPVRIPACG